MLDGKTRNDRREFERKSVDLAAWVTLPGRGQVDCRIANISEGGALIVLDRAEPVPYSFVLTIAGMNGPFGCEVRHHYGNRVGVEFVNMMRVAPNAKERYGGSIGNWIETEAPLTFG